MADTLCEISRSDLPKLRDLYLRQWPKYILPYYTINNYIMWFEKQPDIKNINILALNGDWSDGTYIIVDRYFVLCNSLNKSTENMKTALSLLDYRRKLVFYGFPANFKGIIGELFNQFNLRTRLGDKESETVVYYLPKEKAREFEISLVPGLNLKPVAEDSVSVIDNAWPFQHEGSEYFLKLLIRFNPSIGAYTEDGELVAWCLMLPIGTLGILQVKDSYKRQGLGSLLVKAMSKKLADLDYDISAPVVLRNDASRKMFKKLGFVEQVIENIKWHSIEPENDKFDWKKEYDEK